jgi:glycosyltransferase involved in cell wall biosynthesis
VQAALPFLRTPIRVIPNGVDVDELRRDEPPAAAGGEPPFVLSILQMVHYKGVDILIRAFAALHRHYPELRLKLVSDGPQRESFEQLAASLGVRDRVDFLGWLGRERIVPLLHGCSFFVLPSRTNSESFGIAAAEALACDRAVIASRIGGLPALIEDGLTGLLVPPGDIDALEGAMRRLLDSPELRASLGRAGGDRVRTQFTWERTGEGYERALGGLLAERPLAAREPVLVP